MSLTLEQVADDSDEASDRRVAALVGRILAIVALLVIGFGAPIVLVSTVGLPWPTGAQWTQLRERGRVDTGTVVRIGLAMVAVLWAWFCVSAVHELVTVIGERRSDVAAEAPEHVDAVRTGQRVSWVRRLVRLAVVGGAITAVALAASSLGEPGGGSPPLSTLLSADDTPVTIAMDVSVAPSTPAPLAPAVSVAGPESAESESGGRTSADVGSARSGARWPVTALGGLTALGVVGAIARRRRHQLRTTIPGDVVAIPPSTLVEVEETVRALAAGEDMARVGFALAVAADALDAANSSPLLVSVDSSGGIRMLPTVPALPDGAVWHLDPTDGWWVVLASVDLVDLAAAAATVGPTIPVDLVELGRLVDSSSPDGGARVFIDLARARRLDVAGAASADVVRGLCLGLAVADRQCPVRIVTVGLVRPVSWSSLIRECVSVAEWEHELTLLPVAGDETSESWIGVLPTCDSAAISPDRLERATALITWSEEADERAAGSRPQLLVQGDEATLEPWGLTLVPVRATADVADLVADLVTASVVKTVAIPQEDRVELVPVEVALGLEDPPPSSPNVSSDPPSSGPAFIVRLLGPVRVESTDGVVVEFERSKALELVAWLATHRSRPTRGRARAALWEVDVRTATFHNVISDARRSMARLVTPPDGEEWIARSDSEVLPIHSSVVCDLDLVEQAMESCTDLDDIAAIALLRPVVDLLEGPPFSGTDYLWSDSEGISSSAVLAATSVATELARRCLVLGDTTGVFAATGRGLAVLPGHEELVSLRMRAHDLAGDRAGVRDEWERYLRVIAADAWPGDGDGATPPPKMLALRRTLLP